MASPALAVLLGVLDRTRSPRARIEALLTAARAVRNLSAEERTRLAIALGVQGGAELVEHVAEGEPELRDAMLGALREAQDADPRQLVDTLRALADPARRRQTLRHGAQLGLERARAQLVQAMAPPPGAEPLVPPVVPPPASPRPDATSAPPAEPASTPQAAQRSPAAVSSQPSPVPAVSSARPAPAGTARPPSVVAASPSSPTATVSPVPPGPGPSPPIAIPAAAPAVAPPSGTPAEAPAPAEPPSRPEPWEAAAVPTRSPPRRRSVRAVAPGLRLAERLDGAPRLLERFRVLARALPGLDPGAVDELRLGLERFPDGWPRRRALLMCLRAGLPASTRDALGLVGLLGRPADRRWCETSLRAWRGPSPSR